MSECGKCGVRTGRYDDVIQCENSLCNKLFHIGCVGFTVDKFTEMKKVGNARTWKCDSCPSTPPTDLEKRLTNFMKGMMAELKKDIEEVKESQRYISDQYDDVIKKLGELTELRGKVSALEEEAYRKHQHMEDLSNRLAQLEQYGRNRQLEIRQLHHEEGENVEGLLCRVADKLGVQLQPQDIDACHRIPNKTGKTPVVIVELRSTKKRNELLDQRKKVVTNEELGVGSGRVFVGESMSPYFKQLMWRAKQKAASENWKYVWFRKNRVLARKDDGIKVGLDSHVLKFAARMVCAEPQNLSRRFILSFFLMDDTLSVFETACRNSGYKTQLFIRRREIFKPGQDMMGAVKPEVYKKEDLWVGNVLELEKYKFQLVEAEEYCLRYMELNSLEFPKSNIKLIMNKIKDKLRPVYKDFVCSHLKPRYDAAGSAAEDGHLLPHLQVRQALSQLLAGDITDHEIITVSRHYRAPAPHVKYTRQDIVSLCRNECKRLLWYGLQRLEENLKYKDSCGSGYVSEGVAYSLCRGAKVPIEPDLLTTVMENVARNESGQVAIADLLSFFDYSKGVDCPPAPFNHKKEFSAFARMVHTTDHSWVNCSCFIKDLGLEAELVKESV